MDLKYFEAAAETGVYKLYINDAVGSYEIQGSQIANEIIYLNKINAKRIDMEINSEGGSIIDGVRIASEMVSSSVPIKTINKGYACSIAGVFYLLGDEREMVDFGLLMLHNPQMGGLDMNEVEDPKKKEVMQRMKKQLMQLITSKCKNISDNELSNMMDEETWMNCDEVRAKGWVNRVIPSTEPNAPKKDEMQTMPTMAYVNKIKDFHCSLEQNINNNLNVTQMEDLKKRYESLLTEKDSRVTELTNSIANYKTEIAALKTNYDNILVEKEEVEAKNGQLETEITAQKAKVKEFEDAVAVSIVNEAIEAGKFKADNREALIEKAKADIDGFKSMVEMIPDNQKEMPGKDKPKISELVEMEGALSEISADALNGLTRYEYLQKNDSKKLKSIKDKQPDLYKALQNEYVNKYKGENK
jgi:ATP-dependent protease ClpP protease subunit